MFFETIAKFDTFQFICGTPNVHTYILNEVEYLLHIIDVGTLKNTYLTMFNNSFQFQKRCETSSSAPKSHGC